MSSPAIDAALAELQTADAVVQPAIRGLKDMIADPNTETDTMSALQAELTRLTAYSADITAAITALEALEDTTYPDLPPAQVSDPILASITGKEKDVEAGAARFAPLPPVATSASAQVTILDKPQ